MTHKDVNIKFDPVIHPDIDECSENIDACDHLCSNNVGSYTCDCRSGYRLASDGVTCNGTKLHSYKHIDLMRPHSLQISMNVMNRLIDVIKLA